jgi:hypothetical protein
VREIGYYLTKSDYREFYVMVCARRLWKVCLIGGALLTGLNAWVDYCWCNYITIHAVLLDALWGFGIAVAACFGVLLLNAKYAGRIHDSLEPIAKGQTISWDEEAVRLGSDFYSAAYPWSLFKQSRETKSVIAAYLTSVSPLLFPKRVMSQEELAELRSHLLSAKKV